MSDSGAWNGSQTAEKAFDNSDFTDQTNAASSFSYRCWSDLHSRQNVDDLSYFSSVTEIKWWVYQNNDAQPAEFTVNGSSVTPTLTKSSDTAAGIYEWTLTRAASEVTEFTTGPNTDAGSVTHMLAGVFINGVRLVEGNITLTLTDDTDLENLRVGDAIIQTKQLTPSPL